MHGMDSTFDFCMVVCANGGVDKFMTLDLKRKVGLCSFIFAVFIFAYHTQRALWAGQAYRESVWTAQNEGFIIVDTSRIGIHRSKVEK